jgi:2-dehydropantoate 2-reductase
VVTPDASPARILIWGAGAIGGTIGAYLRRAGHDIAFVDVAADHVAAINATGLRIDGPIERFTVSAPAFLPAQVRGVWDRVFLAVKAHHTEEACRALAPHLAADGTVVSLQNGLCEIIIEQIVGQPRTMGAFVNFSADWIAPGEILFGGRGAVVVGEVTREMTPRLAALHALLLAFEPAAEMTDNIWAYLWGKLGYGAMLFAQALGEKGIADCLARPELLPVWRALAREAGDVARAEGIAPRGFNGFDPLAFTPHATEAESAASVAAMVAFNRPNAKTHSGVWRDLAIRRRRTEVDVQLLPIALIGQRHGLPCPTVRKLVTMIHEVEAGTRALSDDNLLELLQP